MFSTYTISNIDRIYLNKVNAIKELDGFIKEFSKGEIEYTDNYM